jgi:hypothetical protein
MMLPKVIKLRGQAAVNNALMTSIVVHRNILGHRNLFKSPQLMEGGQQLQNKKN